jgi:hypothetical protein
MNAMSDGRTVRTVVFHARGVRKNAHTARLSPFFWNRFTLVCRLQATDASELGVRMGNSRPVNPIRSYYWLWGLELGRFIFLRIPYSPRAHEAQAGECAHFSASPSIARQPSEPSDRPTG